MQLVTDVYWKRKQQSKEITLIIDIVWEKKNK